jgi:putative ABC transport system permease protein
METLFADIRQSLRTLRKNPGFTLVAIAALTIGIGANTGIFSVVNKVLLQPLPYPDPDNLVQLGRKYPNGAGYSNSIPKYMVWRNNNVFSAMTLYDQEGPGFNLSSGDRPQQIKGAHVSVDYFKVFGISPMLGRTFTQAEDLPNGPKAAIISESLWRTHFGSDPQILSRTITLNSEPYPVIGIIPARFAANPKAEIWIALQADPNSANQGHYLAAAARLKPGVPLTEAQAEMRAIGERFRRLYPKNMDKQESVAVTPMRDAMVHDMKQALYILLAAVAFVLLIACANVANLLLARSSARQREFAIRAAVGASRWRVVRQLLTESVMLSVAGGILGLLLGVLGVRGLLLLVPGDIPRLGDPAQLSNPFALLDWRILAFTIGISLLTGILFGLFPALQISNPNLASTLKEAGTRSSTSRHQNFTRKTLVAVEMALALVLLTSAALLIRTFIGLSSAQSGIDSHHVLTMLTSLTGARYQTTPALDLFTRQALQRIETIPGVEAASASVVLPTTNEIDLPLDIPGKAKPAGEQYNGDEQWRSVTAHYFSLFRIPLQRGRVFTEHDNTAAAPAVIVNATFAKKYFPTENPIGKTLEIGKGLGPEFADSPREIVGVVGDVCESGIAAGKVPVMYIPQSQQPAGLTKLASTVIPLAWEVRSSLDEKSLTAAVTKQIQAIDGQMPVAEVRPMDKILADSLSRQNFNMLLLSIFAASALLLAAIGIYGLMSYAVQQQTQELGLRMALGAGKSSLLRLVMRQGMTPALIGVACGLGIAFGLTRLLASLLYEVKPYDPLSFFGVAVILTVVAVLAVLIPARRAMSVDPLTALRTE